MIESSQLEKIAKQVLQHAEKSGATSAEVGLSVDNGFEVTARKGDVEKLEQHKEHSLDITVYFDKRSGSTSTADLSEASWRQALEKACYIAKFTQADECAGLADKEDLAFEYPDLDLYHPWSLTTKQAIDCAVQCEKIALAEDKRIVNSEGVTLSSHEHDFVFANSEGFVGSYPSTQHSMACILLAKENGQMERDYDYTAGCDARDLLAGEQLAKKAAKQTVSRLGARKLSTRQAPVLFSADLAAGFLGCFIRAIKGSSLYRDASFLVGHLDKAIFPEYINLIEKPHEPKVVGSAPFDGDGVRTREHDIVKAGVLKSYVLSAYSARKLGLKTTGNAGGIHNLIVSTSDLGLDALLKKMRTGLYVTELIGQGINIVTGDYSRGIFGYWVENGEIQYPVHEMTIAGNLRDMFKNIVAVGNNIDQRHTIKTGAILLKEMMIGGA